MLKLNCRLETKKIIAFIQKIVATTGREQIIIGWSGGIDSTVSLYLLAKAIPPENIHVLHMPYSTSFINELADSKIPKENVHEISIKKLVDQIWKNIKGDYSLDSRLRGNDPTSPRLRGASLVEKIRLGNIMARVRMIILFDFAKKINGLVCGTENKTEYFLGYFTRYGDGASDIEPIQHLFKTQVYELAKYLHVPNIIIKKTPSANLWKGQTDEGEFGFTYKEADEVLLRYIDTSKSLREIEKEGFKNAKKIIEFMKKNEFKRKVPYTL